MAKPNGYQSVHRRSWRRGHTLRGQIRTLGHAPQPNTALRRTEYTSGEQGVKEGDEEKFAWVRRLLEAQQETDATAEFVHDLKIDMFAGRGLCSRPRATS